MAEQSIPEHIYDVVIIGGGPAGLTAGIYAARAAMKVLILEGMITTSQITMTDIIENFPGFPEGIGGFDLVDRFKKQVLQFGAAIKTEDVRQIVKKSLGAISGWEVMTSDGSYETFSLIVATGASWRKLGVEGEERLTGRGVSYCATCDGPLYRNQDVVVIGGGNAAIQEALFLTRFVKKVTIVHRRDQLRADAALQKKAFDNPKIEFAWHAVIDRIVGDEFVQAVNIKEIKTGEIKTIPTDGVFVFIGRVPNTELLRGLINLEKDGAIITNDRMQTSADGIFACGDCIHKLLRQVITACGDGATAAHCAHLYVEALRGETYGT
jgi:thioredoxin reductase (NADPH)